MVERVALVTGAARGIGAATVRRLSALGYGVVATDWCRGDDSPAGYAMPTRADLAAVAAAGEVVDLVADVRDEGALRDATDLAFERWGRLDAVVAAAAIVAGGMPAWHTPTEDLDLMWDVGARGVWNTARVTVPRLVEAPNPSQCRFVAVASAAGEHGLHGLAAYNVVKHAVVGLVKGLAADLAGTGVTAVAVSPGSTRTAMLSATGRLYGIDDVEHFARNQLLHRLLEPAEVAEVVAFCCGLGGAVFNGDVLRADGGFMK